MEKHIVPRVKDDDEAIDNLKSCSFNEIKEQVPQLLEWLQDGNWPVSAPIFNYLLPHVNDIEDEILKIFRTDDGVWKYWVLGLISHFPGKISDRILQEVKRIAEHPMRDEIIDEVQQEAIDVLQDLELKR